MELSITKEFGFEAAHQLTSTCNTYGACENMHGHSYKLFVTVKGEVNEDGWIMNFKDLKLAVNTTIVDRLDHTTLNDSVHKMYMREMKECDMVFPEFVDEAMKKKLTTCEVMATMFLMILTNHFGPSKKVKIKLYETATSFCEVE